MKMIENPLKVVYGINTGFGSFANVCISPDQRHQLQLNLIRSHSVGVGIPTPLDIVRRM
jgi:histidine ammonia-lyase